jgi:hypothetical protein
VTTYDGFGLEAHTGNIVGSYVTASATPPPGSRGMIGEQSMSWSKQELVAENSVIGPQVVYQKPETIYYVTAIVTYPRGVEHNVTYYNNCSLTLQGYAKYSSAKGNLKHVPLGKQKSVHLSKRHHGRYCIDTPDFVYSRDVGLPLLLTGCGLLSLMFASICVVGCKDEQRTVNTAVETAIAADTSPVPANHTYYGVELTHPHGAAELGPVVSGGVAGSGGSVRVSGWQESGCTVLHAAHHRRCSGSCGRRAVLKIPTLLLCCGCAESVDVVGFCGSSLHSFTAQQHLILNCCPDKALCEAGARTEHC